VSVSSTGERGNGDSFGGPISRDGRYVAFSSSASNLVSVDTNGTADVFVRDRTLGTTERVSVTSGGAQAHGAFLILDMTPDARFVLFRSDAPDLVPDDTNGVDDVFLRDRLLGTTERVSVLKRTQQSTAATVTAYVSDDGRFVAFQALGPGVFVRDRARGARFRGPGAPARSWTG
jgi:Tol biopolymer transport system component